MSTPDYLTDVFRRLRHTLRALAADIAGSRDADDIVSDAFCSLWSCHPEVRAEVDAIRLSRAVVRNKAIDALRRNGSRPATTPIDEAITASVEADDSDERERRDTYEAVIALSRRRLQGRQLEVFMLHDVEGLEYAEVAERMGLTIENVRVALSRARHALRETYNSSHK